MQLVPIEPPAFLRPLHAAFMRAGTQLRLLHSLEPQGQRLAQQLGAIAEAEVLQRRGQQLATSSGGGGGTEVGAFAGAAHTLTSFAAPPAVEAAAEAALQAADGGPREPWLALAGAPAAPLPPSAGGAVDGTQDLHVSAGSLQQAAVVSQEQDGARSAAVDGWLGQMALQRRLAEHAAAADHLGRAAAQRERQAQRAAAQAAALSRQQSSKAALFEEQRGAVREARARRAMQREQVEASDRQAQLQAAQREHAAAVAELERALGRSSLTSGPAEAAAPAAAETPAQAEAAAPTEAALSEAAEAASAAGLPAAASAEAAAAEAGPGSLGQAAVEQRAPLQAHERPAAGFVPYTRRPRGLPPLKLSSLQVPGQQEQEAARPALPVATARGSQATARRAILPGPLGLPMALRMQAVSQPPGVELGSSLQPAAGAAAAAAGAQYLPPLAPPLHEEESESVPAPLPAVLECCVAQSVLSQYRAVSRACVRWVEGPRRGCNRAKVPACLLCPQHSSK